MKYNLHITYTLDDVIVFTDGRNNLVNANVCHYYGDDKILTRSNSSDIFVHEVMGFLLDNNYMVNEIKKYLFSL